MERFTHDPTKPPVRSQVLKSAARKGNSNSKLLLSALEPALQAQLGNADSITYDSTLRLFSLRTQNTYYALRIDDQGLALHVGWGTAPAGSGPVELAHLEQYPEPDFVFSWDCARHELPPYGDVATHDVALKVVFPQPAVPPLAGEALNIPVRDVRPRYVSHEIDSAAEPGFAPAHRHHARSAHRQRETLRVRMKDALYDFFVTLCYRITPELDLIERWVELENGTTQDVVVESLAFSTLHLEPAKYELNYVNGGWGREFTSIRQELNFGKFVLDQRGLNTGHASNPFFMLGEAGVTGEESGTVFFGALTYSGNWALRFEQLPTGYLRVHGGYESTDFELRLSPGEGHKTPAMLLGVCNEGRGGASRRLHRFAREYVLPHAGVDRYRPILYNSWEATEFNVSYENQSKLAAIAADLGVELFVVDDGWFGGRRHDKAGLGDWVVNEASFPGGLNRLIDEVKTLGMNFGLWFEPEMVNVDSDLYRAHPDWILHFPGRARTEHRNQLILDLGRSEVIDYLFGAIDAMLQRHDIRFIKWDMNRSATEPGSVVGRAIWYKHVQGVYSIIDRLRQRHPKLHIEACSGGGGRIDLACWPVLIRPGQAIAAMHSIASQFKRASASHIRRV